MELGKEVMSGPNKGEAPSKEECERGYRESTVGHRESLGQRSREPGLHVWYREGKQAWKLAGHGKQGTHVVGGGGT